MNWVLACANEALWCSRALNGSLTEDWSRIPNLSSNPHFHRDPCELLRVVNKAFRPSSSRGNQRMWPFWFKPTNPLAFLHFSALSLSLSPSFSFSPFLSPLPGYQTVVGQRGNHFLLRSKWHHHLSFQWLSGVGVPRDLFHFIHHGLLLLLFFFVVVVVVVVLIAWTASREHSLVRNGRATVVSKYFTGITYIKPRAFILSPSWLLLGKNTQTHITHSVSKAHNHASESRCFARFPVLNAMKTFLLAEVESTVVCLRVSTKKSGHMIVLGTQPDLLLLIA